VYCICRVRLLKNTQGFLECVETGQTRDESTGIGDVKSHTALLISAAILAWESMIHSHEPLSFKADARFALSPNAPEVPIMAIETRLRYCQGAPEVACSSLSLRVAIQPVQEQTVHG
jgi:hypothetical protein